MKLSLVALEGAFSDIDPAPFQFFERNDLNRIVRDSLLRQGYLTGAELVAYDQWEKKQKGAEFRGVDDPKLYQESLERLKFIFNQSQDVVKFLARWDGRLAKAEKRPKNPALQGYLRFLHDWKTADADSDFHRMLEELQGSAKEILGIDLADPVNQFDYPNLTRLVKLSEMESELKPESSRRELEEIGHLLVSSPHDFRRGSPTCLAGPLRRSFSEASRRAKPFGDDERRELQKGLRNLDQIKGVRRFFEKLYSVASRSGISLLAYPDFLNQAGILILKEELNIGKVSSEIERLSAAIRSHLEVQQENRVVIEKREIFFLLARLLRLELQPEEFERFQERKKQIRRAFKDVPDEWFQAAETFYELSRQRDAALLENALRLVRHPEAQGAEGSPFMRGSFDSAPQSGAPLRMTSVIILITGGFHTAGLKRLMREKGIGYAVLSPHLTRLGTPSLYKNVMLGLDLQSAMPPSAANLSLRPTWDADVSIPGRFKRFEIPLEKVAEAGVSPEEIVRAFKQAKRSNPSLFGSADLRYDNSSQSFSTVGLRSEARAFILPPSRSENRSAATPKTETLERTRKKSLMDRLGDPRVGVRAPAAVALSTKRSEVRAAYMLQPPVDPWMKEIQRLQRFLGSVRRQKGREGLERRLIDTYVEGWVSKQNPGKDDRPKKQAYVNAIEDDETGIEVLRELVNRDLRSGKKTMPAAVDFLAFFIGLPYPPAPLDELLAESILEDLDLLKERMFQEFPLRVRIPRQRITDRQISNYHNSAASVAKDLLRRMQVGYGDGVRLHIRTLTGEETGRNYAEDEITFTFVPHRPGKGRVLLGRSELRLLEEPLGRPYGGAFRETVRDIAKKFVTPGEKFPPEVREFLKEDLYLFPSQAKVVGAQTGLDILLLDKVPADEKEYFAIWSSIHTDPGFYVRIVVPQDQEKQTRIWNRHIGNEYGSDFARQLRIVVAGRNQETVADVIKEVREDLFTRGVPVGTVSEFSDHVNLVSPNRNLLSNAASRVRVGYLIHRSAPNHPGIHAALLKQEKALALRMDAELLRRAGPLEGQTIDSQFLLPSAEYLSAEAAFDTEYYRRYFYLARSA